MKKTIVIAAIFAVLLNVNCKKNESTFQSYLRFKLDNEQIECKTNISASHPIFPDDVIIEIAGDWSGGTINLFLQENQVLTPGAYPFIFGMSRSVAVYITTNPTLTDLYATAGGGIFDLSVPGSGQIVINEISPEYIKGSFECVLGVTLGKIKVLTNGEFHIKRG
jgi:hypothetical protein